jgi:3-oxoacyl-[acyl-carrier-protein] synthase II
MGEEVAGASATEIAWRRIGAGQGDIFLVGGACSAERKDSVLNCALGGVLWAGEHVPVWERAAKGGGAMLGSAGAFLVLEAREHAEKRGKTPYARLGTVLSGRSRREPGQATAVAAAQFATLRKEAGDRALAVISGANGILRPTREERDWLAGLKAEGAIDTVRAMPNMLGACVEATFPAMVALSALALSRKAFYRSADDTGFEPAATTAPEAVVMNAWGSWRGEGMGLVLPAR